MNMKYLIKGIALIIIFTIVLPVFASCADDVKPEEFSAGEEVLNDTYFSNETKITENTESTAADVPAEQTVEATIEPEPIPVPPFEPDPIPAPPVETVTESEPIIPIFEDVNAKKLYDTLIANRVVWERENMIDGTLIDLDFDGTPEFILMHQNENYLNSMTVFKFDGDTMREIKHIEQLFVSESYAYGFRVILPYTNENGAKNWVLPYVKYTGEWNSDVYYYEYYLSAFDFTGKDIKETVKFYCKVNYHYKEREKYREYDYFDAQFYIDGVEHKASQDKLDKFMVELDRYIRECDEAEAEGNRISYPWDCGQYYPTPSQAEWEDLKKEFLNSFIFAESAYNLFPNIEVNYIDSYAEGAWNTENNIILALKNLAESYTEGGKYLRTTDLYYDSGAAFCKPVIYLYPVEITDISVQVEFLNGGNFTCTYPDYGGGWNVTAYPDGTIINKADNLEYSYLYWEGEGDANWDYSSGFVVKGGDTAAFLREKLAYLGLTPKEYNEFIVYWLPLMQNNKYNFITFQTAEYEKSAKLHVSPEPDSILRVFMAYIPLENAVEIPEQQLSQFERIGFSVIEWGGVCVE